MVPHRSSGGRVATYLVLRTSAESAKLPQRCAAWARRTGADVDVTGPVAGEELIAPLADSRYAGAVLELPPGVDKAVADDEAVADAVATAPFPVVAVSRGQLTGAPSVVEAACADTFAGRGPSGFQWALWHLHARHEQPPHTVSYGHHPAHVGDLRLPDTAGAAPVVVLVHGGFWRHEWGRDLMDGLALDLTSRGYATWNIEYRRTGPTGGGWPATRDDVVRAVTALPELAAGRVDPHRVVLLGHSAGAQLALSVASGLTSLRPALVVAMSGIFDLERAARDGVGWGSVEAFLGDAPDDAPDRYHAASPMTHVPIGLSQVLVHGTVDEHVPPTQSEMYRDRAVAAGDEVDLVRLEGADHFSVIDPTSDAWAATAGALEQRVPPSQGRDGIR